MTRDQHERYVWAMVARTHRYEYGGDDPIQGFDCSGLVQEFLTAAGAMPAMAKQNAQMLFDRFYPLGFYPTGVLANPDHYGAIAFYGSGHRGISHVGFCISVSHMVEAGGGGADTKSDQVAIARNAFVKLRPIRYRSDFIGLLRPRYPWDIEGAA